MATALAVTICLGAGASVILWHVAAWPTRVPSWALVRFAPAEPFDTTEMVREISRRRVLAAVDESVPEITMEQYLIFLERYVDRGLDEGWLVSLPSEWPREQPIRFTVGPYPVLQPMIRTELWIHEAKTNALLCVEFDLAAVGIPDPDRELDLTRPIPATVTDAEITQVDLELRIWRLGEGELDRQRPGAAQPLLVRRVTERVIRR